jgi:hypothetical protein
MNNSDDQGCDQGKRKSGVRFFPLGGSSGKPEIRFSLPGCFCAMIVLTHRDMPQNGHHAG